MKSYSDEGVKTCKTISGLSAIKTPDTELVIWQRSHPSHFQDWINQIDTANLPDARILVKPKEFRRAVKSLLNKCGLTVGEMRDLLVADMNDLVAGFADITQSEEVDVRLERINGDACWKFHRDTVKTRLVTTYRGPTTEWVRQAYADQAINKQRDFNGPLERLKIGNVAIFKGLCSSPNRGVVHRSPPISGTGLTRLLLCLNQRTNASPEPWVDSYPQ